MDFLEELIVQPGAVVFLSAVFAFISILMLRLLLGDLLRMHKSKTAVKKISKQYAFCQKLCLRHVSEHCEHAVRFSRFLVWVHNIYAPVSAVCLISGWILPARYFVYGTVMKWILLDVPIWLLMFVLDAHPFRKRKHQWRFAKYHNTSDKTSLF